MIDSTWIDHALALVEILADRGGAPVRVVRRRRRRWWNKRDRVLAADRASAAELAGVVVELELPADLFVARRQHDVAGAGRHELTGLGVDLGRRRVPHRVRRGPHRLDAD